MIINIGDKIGNLTILEFSHKDKWHKSYYKCKCDCGNIIIVRDTTLKFHKTPSCGCVKYKKHGMTRTRLYRIWCDMKSRCLNKNTARFNFYGGKGISVCDEWLNFENFMNWSILNGYREDLTLDRIDGDSNYTPHNCRWTSCHTQSANKGLNKNNKSGYTGVCKHRKIFMSYITIYKERKILGYFKTAEEAVLKRNNYIKMNKLNEYKIQEIKSV
ncbi:MAG: hypothetical protein J6S85_02235 [Methanobrevibacter sp.]|nr:hypothetical protein [Methanobrevibacter sp.]MBO7712356.1 hypothetical protein [Methanobrevibacter sp.]